MEYLVIEPPDYNDSFSRVILNGTEYFLRFTWNDLAARWMFGVYDSQKNPLIEGIKVVPSCPLNLFCDNTSLPGGVFGVITENEAVGRNDFLNGLAQFIFIPAAGI